MPYHDPFPPAEPPRVDGVLLSHLIPVVFGDWSGDGHGGIDRQYFWSNHPVSVWRRAIYDGECKSGVNLRDICGDYEDTSISPEIESKLKAAGYSCDFKNPECITPQDYMNIFLFLLSLGNPRIIYHNIRHGPHYQEVHAGGYGLFND